MAKKRHSAAKVINKLRQISFAERQRQIEWSLAQVADCIIKHERAHVQDVVCDEVPGARPPSGCRSGSLAASEEAGYLAERDCVTTALVKCGTNPYCQSAVRKAISAWNASAATPVGARGCNLAEPLAPMEIK